MEPRSSQLVLDKLTSLVAGAAGEERQYWMPDDISVGDGPHCVVCVVQWWCVVQCPMVQGLISVQVECYDCTSKFTTLRRRHHCRICGQVDTDHLTPVS